MLWLARDASYSRQVVLAESRQLKTTDIHQAAIGDGGGVEIQRSHPDGARADDEGMDAQPSTLSRDIGFDDNDQANLPSRRRACQPRVPCGASPRHRACLSAG